MEVTESEIMSFRSHFRAWSQKLYLKCELREQDQHYLLLLKRTRVELFHGLDLCQLKHHSHTQRNVSD